MTGHGTAEATSILLLKTESSPADDYREHFTTNTTNRLYDPRFVPVVEHIYNADSLQWLKHSIERGVFLPDFGRTGTKDGFSGIIFTSQRAVEAFARVVSALDTGHKSRLLPQTLPLYVVGPATAKSLESLGLECPVLGAQSGNGAALADFILEHHDRTHVQPLLFLVGEQRRDIIPKTLQSVSLPAHRRIAVVEKTVYESRELSSLSQSLADTLQQCIDSRTLVSVIWIVVFSPTGCMAVLEHLKVRSDLVFQDGSVGPENRLVLRLPRVCVATIGPTTKEFLMQTCGFTPHACAEQPSPRGVERAIQAFCVAEEHDNEADA